MGSTLTRFLSRHTGRIVFHEVTGKRYNRDTTKFAGTVFWKHHGQNMNQLSGRWDLGFWVGKLGRTDEHEVLTLDGVQQCRGCLR